MHKHTKFDGKNSWVNLEKSILSESVGNMKQATERPKSQAETVASADDDIACMIVLGPLYYKTDD
jgi:hypothetical protein